MSRALPNDLACKQIVVLVTDYVEGELPADERTRFEHHLVTCRECIEYVRQMRQTKSLVHAQGADADAGAARPELTLTEPTRSRLLETFRAFKRTP